MSLKYIFINFHERIQMRLKKLDSQCRNLLRSPASHMVVFSQSQSVVCFMTTCFPLKSFLTKYLLKLVFIIHWARAYTFWYRITRNVVTRSLERDWNVVTAVCAHVLCVAPYINSVFVFGSQICSFGHNFIGSIMETLIFAFYHLRMNVSTRMNKS